MINNTRLFVITISLAFSLTFLMIPSAKATSCCVTIQVGNHPDSVAINSKTNMIYVGNTVNKTISVINGTTKTVVDTIKLGASPQAIGIDIYTNKIFTANGKNKLTVINSKTDSIIHTIKVPSFVSGIGVN